MASRLPTIPSVGDAPSEAEAVAAEKLFIASLANDGAMIARTIGLPAAGGMQAPASTKLTEPLLLHPAAPIVAAVAPLTPVGEPCSANLPAVVAVCVGCLGSLNFGTVLGFTSPAEPRIRDDLLGGLTDPGRAERLGGVFSSVVSLGALVSLEQSSAARIKYVGKISVVHGLCRWAL